MFSNRTVILRPHTQARLTETRQRLLSDRCLYLGSPAMRDRVEWLRVGSCDKLILKPEVAAAAESQGRDSCPPEGDTDPDAAYNQPFELADLVAVGTLSDEDFFFTADAGWRPGSIFAPALEDSRASASLDTPDVALFAPDFPVAIENIRYLQNVVAPNSTASSCRGPFTGPAEAPRIRVRHIFFESVEAPPVASAETDQQGNTGPESGSTSGTANTDATMSDGAPPASQQSGSSVESASARDTSKAADMDSETAPGPSCTAPAVVSDTETATVTAADTPAAEEPAELPDLEPALGPEFQIENWPAYSEEGRAALTRMATLGTHKVIPLPAYNMHGDLIGPRFYRARLQGAVVELHFSLTHWRIGERKDRASAKVDVFVAELDYLRVLVPPKPSPVTPRKRKVSAVDPTPSPSPSKRARMSSPAGPGLGSPVKKVARK
ncbi:hypothetical protein C8T65DRAFT_735857 [Cerioporus squamosus]|nr:hypothetical protein C8T65DRAFT_735857 [Cerioporus squamosus]